MAEKVEADTASQWQVLIRLPLMCWEDWVYSARGIAMFFCKLKIVLKIERVREGSLYLQKIF